MVVSNTFVIEKSNAVSKELKFVINDESVNDRGYSILTSGIDLSRFEKNPVCLAFHATSLLPVGKWRLEKKGNVLFGYLSFDEKDEFAVQLKAKYEGGFMSGISVGIVINQMTASNVATSSELYEISLVVLPSNKASVLIKLSSKSSSNMKLVAQVLGIDEDEAVAVVRINELHSRIAAYEKAERDRLTTDLIASGMVVESLRDTLSSVSLEKLREVHAKIPAAKKGIAAPAQTIGSQLKITGSGVVEEDFEYLSKNNAQKLLEIKQNHPEEYRKLVSAYTKKQK
jgi:hypothetical protein